jgi:hypothetical protein
MKKDNWEDSDFVDIDYKDTDLNTILNTDLDIIASEFSEAIQSYFYTYYHYFIHLNLEEDINVARPDDKKLKGLERLQLLNGTKGNYIDDYKSLVIKLHHFFELLIKLILEACDPCLVINPKTDKDYLSLVSYLTSASKDTAKIKNINSVEFSSALSRLCILFGAGSSYSYTIEAELETIARILTKNKNALDKLNNLRNRMIHRGKKTLSYKILDDYMTGEILPMLSDLFDDNDFFLKCEEIKGSINSVKKCVEKMIALGSRKDYRKIAVYKEIGRCIYYVSDNYYEQTAGENSLFDIDIKLDGKIKDGHLCPICGREALKLETDDIFNFEPYHKKYKYYNCSFCTFRAEKSIGDSFFRTQLIPDIS